jgi:hypothetical protein
VHHHTFVITWEEEYMFTKRLLQMAVIYLIVGILIGLGMGISENHILAPVHAHVNLLGWGSMGLMALIYRAYPDAATTTLAKVHFWLHSVGLPPLMIMLAVMMLGNPALGPVVGILSIVTGVGVISYCVNMLRFIR